jgi:hypothetical protein
MWGVLAQIETENDAIWGRAVGTRSCSGCHQGMKQFLAYMSCAAIHQIYSEPRFQ